jgi:predicted nucleic acid-binding protein
MGVVAWLAEADEHRIFLSVITIAERRHGIERLPAGARPRRLDTWLTKQVPLRFAARLLVVDAETADIWAKSWHADRRWGIRPARWTISSPRPCCGMR